MALIVCYALLGSLMLALTLIRSQAMYLFRGPTRILRHPPLEQLNELFGVAVMSGVLYISDINRRRGLPDAQLRDAIVEGARAQSGRCCW